MNERTGDYREEIIPVPDWQRDILNTSGALGHKLHEVQLGINGIQADAQLGKNFRAAFKRFSRHLPEYYLFRTDTLDVSSLEKNPIGKLLADTAVRETKWYYLPKKGIIYSVDSNFATFPTPQNYYPEGEDFLGFDQILGPRSRLGHQEGINKRDIDSDRPAFLSDGISISLPPHLGYKLLESTRELLAEKLGIDGANAALADLDTLMSEYEAQVETYRLRESPHVKTRILNLRNAILRSRYGSRLPHLAELKRYSNDPDPSYFYFATREGRLVKSPTPGRRNFLGRITSIPDADFASNAKLVEKGDRIKYVLEDPLPPGWAVWDMKKR